MKNNIFRRVSLSAVLVMATATAFAASPDNTMCNPCNLTYRFSLESDDASQLSYREAADPTMVVFKGEYYLFASKCGGYYHSTDLVNWDLIHTDDLPIEGYAPTVEEMGGKLYFTYSTGTYEIYVTDDPKTGSWTKVEGAGTSSGLADPMLLFDNNRMFLYYGSSGDPTSYIQGVELSTETLTPIGDASNLLRCSMDVNGWEVPGDYNGNKSSSPWLEGAWVTVRDGKYYLQYSSPGTEMKAYNDGVYVADDPLGPYTVQRHNPFCYRPEGFIAASGHGSTFVDNYGNYWHIATGTISKRHMFERRLVLYPVFFDEDGEMYAYTGYGDYPMIVPDHKISSPDELSTGWMLLSYGKSVTASSSLSDYPASNAVNEDIRTWWSASSADAGEYITVDLASACTIQAIQVNFAEQDAVAWGEQSEAYQYKVEVSLDGETWTAVVDKSDNTVNAPNDYVQLATAATGRYVRLTNVNCPYGKFSVSGLRVFGNAEKSLPTAPAFSTIIRSSDDARTVNLTWEAVDDAVGYNIRYGYSEDKMYLNYTVYGTNMLSISSLSTNETYYFTIDAFNEAGITLGTEVVEVAAGAYYASDPNAGFFPLTQGGVNPNIFGTGSYDADTHTLITGQYGFGGWEYAGGVDWSGYSTLVVELEAPVSGVTFRIFDEDSYWTEPVSFDMGSTSTREITLAEQTKTVDGETVAFDPSHVYICGFWSYGNTPIVINSVYLKGAIETGIEGVAAAPVSKQGSTDDVYNLSGTKVSGKLPAGVYIVGGRKVVAKG